MTASPVTGYTDLYRFNLINYLTDAGLIQKYEQQNWTRLDGYLASLNAALIVWANNTTYNLYDRVIDPLNHTIYICLVPHISPSGGTFAAARQYNPSYWIALDKSYLGLSNVDNTSDVNKPVSTATQSAINTAVSNITSTINIVAVPTVASLAGLPDKDRILVDGYFAPGDGGGGILVRDPTSTRTVNNGTVFPAIIGKYIRPTDGFLHTKWFGIKHNGTGDQSQRMQAFIVEVVNTDYRGFIDPATDGSRGIECAGATLYVTADGTRKVYKDPTGPQNAANSNRPFGTHLEGIREASYLNNCVLCCNAPYDPTYGKLQTPGSAGGVRLANFRVYGGCDQWNLQGDCCDEFFQVYYYYDVKREYNDTNPWVDGHAMQIFGCNHQLLLDVGTYGTTNAGANSQPFGGGLRIAGCTNMRIVSGAFNNGLNGLTAQGILDPTKTDGSYIPGMGVNIRLAVLGTHMEGNWKETVAADYIQGAELRFHGRPYGPWDGTNYAFIRLGSAKAQALNVKIEDCYFINSNPDADTAGGGVGTAILATNTSDLIIGNNKIINFATPINLTANATQTSYKKNTYLNCGPNVIDPAASFQPDDPTEIAKPYVVSTTTNIILLDASLCKRRFSVQLNVSNHIVGALKNAQPGVEYTLFITKTASTNKISAWNSLYKFAGGTAFDYASMAVGQTAKVGIVFDGTNYLVTSTVIG